MKTPTHKPHYFYKGGLWWRIAHRGAEAKLSYVLTPDRFGVSREGKPVAMVCSIANFPPVSLQFVNAGT